MSDIQAYANSLADLLHDSVVKVSKTLLQPPLVDSEKLSQIDMECCLSPPSPAGKTTVTGNSFMVDVIAATIVVEE